MVDGGGSRPFGKIVVVDSQRVNGIVQSSDEASDRFPLTLIAPVAVEAQGGYQ